MGKIKMPPEEIKYPYPKALGKKGYSISTIKGRAMIVECSKKWGDYTRILDLVRHSDGNLSLRFCQFYRKPDGNDNDWIYGQGAGHMGIETFYKVIEKAKTNPDYGSFEGVLDKVKIV